MIDLIHRWRRPFVLLNGLAILGWSLAGVVLGEKFWELLGVAPGDSPLLRLLAWYLAVHGLGAVLVARAPERQPVVVLMVGVEKIGAAVCFALLIARGASPLLGVVGAFDATMAVVFVIYALSLFQRGETTSA